MASMRIVCIFLCCSDLQHGNILGMVIAYVIAMKTAYIVLAVVIGMMVSDVNASENNSPAVSEVSWMKKTFQDLSWNEIIAVAQSPKDISRRVKTRVTYKTDVQDEMKPGVKTWNEKQGDCEDFANCVVELCKAKGFDAWVEVYFEANNSRAHAVAMGTWNGKLWMSSNGNFQFVGDVAKAGRAVAMEMGWKSKSVYHEKYDSTREDGLTVASVAGMEEVKLLPVK